MSAETDRLAVEAKEAEVILDAARRAYERKFNTFLGLFRSRKEWKRYKEAYARYKAISAAYLAALHKIIEGGESHD